MTHVLDGSFKAVRLRFKAPQISEEERDPLLHLRFADCKLIIDARCNQCRYPRMKPSVPSAFFPAPRPARIIDPLRGQAARADKFAAERTFVIERLHFWQPFTDGLVGRIDAVEISDVVES